MYAPPLSAAFFGKLPAHGDFVRHNASSPAMRAMDHWLQRGLYAARSQRAFDFNTAFEAAHAVQFYADSGNAALVGVLQPSRDRVGRKYPFLLAFEPASAADPYAAAMAPVRYAPFYEQAGAVAQEAAGGAPPQQVAARMDTLVLRDADRNTLDRFLRETTSHALWEDIWGYADDSRKYRLFKNLLDVLLPLRGAVPPRYELVLRFPTGRTAGRHGLVAGFWMLLCHQILGASRLHPSSYWTVPDGGEEGFVFYALRPPPPELYAHFVAPQAESQAVCKLDEMGSLSGVQALLAIPDRYGALLEADDLSLSAFLDRH